MHQSPMASKRQLVHEISKVLSTALLPIVWRITDMCGRLARELSLFADTKTKIISSVVKLDCGPLIDVELELSECSESKVLNISKDIMKVTALKKLRGKPRLSGAIVHVLSNKFCGMLMCSLFRQVGIPNLNVTYEHVMASMARILLSACSQRYTEEHTLCSMRS